MKIPERWKLVPVEPTEEMVIVLEDAYCDQLDVRIGDPNRKEWPSEDSQPLAGRLAYRAVLAAAPTPPAQSHQLDDAEIRAIALDCGFKLKPQPDGLEDLNPYVYKFARELLSTIPRPEDVAALREQLTPSSQEDEPVAWMDVHDNWDLYKNKPSQVDVVPLYTRPDNSELRKAAEEIESRLRNAGLEHDADYLRAALEGK